MSRVSDKPGRHAARMAARRLARGALLLLFAAEVFLASSAQAEVALPRGMATPQRSVAELLDELVEQQQAFEGSIPDMSGYSVVWLGDLPGGKFLSAAHGINSHDTVVGFGTDDKGFRATVWRKIGFDWVIEPLPSQEPSKAFVITGSDFVGGSHGFYPAVWTFDKDGQSWRLAELPGEGAVLWIAEDGQAAAGFVTQRGRNVPTTWKRNGNRWERNSNEAQERTLVEPFVRKVHKDVFATGFNDRGAITGFAQKQISMELPVPQASTEKPKFILSSFSKLIAADFVQEAMVAFPGSGGYPLVAEGSAGGNPPGGLGGGGAGFTGGGGGFGGGGGGGADGGGGGGGGSNGGGGDDGGGEEPPGELPPAVPEPSSVIAWLLTGAVLLAGWSVSRWRRRLQSGGVQA